METTSIALCVLAAQIVIIDLSVRALVARFKFLRTYTNGFVVSLAISDLLTGAVFFPIHLHKDCSLIGFTYTLIVFAGVTNTCAVTFDRHTAITRPLVYYLIISKYFIIIIVTSWLIPFLLCLLPLFWNTDATSLSHKVLLSFLLIGVNLIASFLIFVAYLRILRKVHNSLKLRQRHCNLSVQSRTFIEGRVARVSTIACTSFALSWFPILYITTMSIIGRNDLTPQWLPVLSDFTVPLASIVNPLFYSCMKPDFASALRKLFRGSTDPVLICRRSTSSARSSRVWHTNSAKRRSTSDSLGSFMWQINV